MTKNHTLSHQLLSETEDSEYEFTCFVGIELRHVRIIIRSNIESKCFSSREKKNVHTDS